ncbi:vomeronasal type-1 receptor 90-like [Sciurus carolinensis]|uniref:vomeronasal type-1 receptor 90-like n=1 Tax=Sciurus carolinensis TaxID=30640 RepID=UPI001FB25E1F|nr:vomeronasal type-1 receptor 90-like [Sciurus carolinensis]
MKKTNQLYDYISIRNAFFSEVGIGISANTILLLFHIFMFLLQHKLTPTDWIIGLLALIHLGLLIILVYMATNNLLSQDFWDDIKCKSIIYLHMFLRGLSICATCLLSVLQAITLSPRTSCLAKFNHKSPHQILCSLVFLWVFYMSLSTHYYSAAAISNVTSDSIVSIIETCKTIQMSYILRHLFYALSAFRDVFLIGLMALSSVYMVGLLCRHKRQFQHLHSTRHSSRACPVQRATSTILLLMSFFVLMYYLDTIFYSSRTMRKDDPVCFYIHMMLCNGYATTSPLLLICTEKHIISLLKYYWMRIAHS